MTGSSTTGGSHRQRDPSRGFPFAAAVFLGALLVALGYNLLAVGARAPLPAWDAIEYDLLGRKLAEGEGFLGTKRTPLFPLFLGGVYALVGVNHFVVRVLLSVMAAALVVVIYLLGRETLGERAARWGAGIGVIYPPLFVWSSRLNTEIPFTLLFTTFLLFLARGARPEGRAPALAGVRTPGGPASGEFLRAGLVLGLAMLTRPAGAFVLPLLPLWAWWRGEGRGGWRAGLRRLLLVLVPAALVVAPWTLRNWRVTGEFVPLSTLGGNVLLGGNNPVVGRGADGWVAPEASGLLTTEELVGLETMSEPARDRLFRDRALSYVRTHPRAAATLLVRKMAQLWEFIPPSGGLRAWITLGPYYAVLLLAVAGAWLARRRGRLLLPLYLAVFSTLLAVAVTWGGRRFRHPLEPELVLFAGAALAAGAGSWARRRRGAAA